MSSARERHERRKKRRADRARRMSSQQVASSDSPRPRERPTFKLNIPGARYLLLIPAAVLLVIGVVALLGLINPPEAETYPNAIWLGRNWTYSDRPDSDFESLAAEMRESNVGTVYAFISSMKVDGTWSGDPDGRNRFTEVEESVLSFAGRFRQVFPEVTLYAWIEVRATTPEGYRLDSTQVQQTVADLSRTSIETYGYDGVLLDVKPLFDGNEDYLQLLRTVRGSVGLDATIAVAVPPDLTPTDADLTLPPQIAPGTVWSAEYKQRVVLQADTLVVTAYNSYLTSPLDYINWVAYQVQAFMNAPGDIQTDTRVVISIPAYDDNLPAHDSSVESIASALDGVRRGLEAFDETLLPRLRGVAIFPDRDLTPEDWRTFREKWNR